MKKKSPPQQKLDQFPNFLDVESNVFSQIGNKIYIGKFPIPDDLRKSLRDDANLVLKTRLWEIIQASVINEAYNLSLIQSTEWDHVQFAKAMKHWSVFMEKVIHNLSL